MNPRPLTFFAAWIFAIISIALSPNAVRAQSASPVPVAAPAAQPQDSAPSNSPPASAQPAAKKVWTNDDVGDLHANSVISTLGDSSARPVKTAAKPAPNSKNKGAAWYRGQITKLQEQLPPIDQKISDLQTVINGGQVNEVRHYGGNKIDDWHDELARLQTQREGIVTKISALQDQARHDGVSPSDLP